jgi:NhaP-type Na+/H+ or K+/H+ antiporter
MSLPLTGVCFLIVFFVVLFAMFVSSWSAHQLSRRIVIGERVHYRRTATGKRAAGQSSGCSHAARNRGVGGPRTRFVTECSGGCRNGRRSRNDRPSETPTNTFMLRHDQLQSRVLENNSSFESTFRTSTPDVIDVTAREVLL